MNKKLLFHPMVAATASAVAPAIPAPTLAIVPPHAAVPTPAVQDAALDARLDARLSDAMDTLDALHTAISEGRMAGVVAVSRRELVAWLYDVAFLVEETIEEVEAGSNQKSGVALPRPTLVEAPGDSRPALTLVRKSS